MKEILKKIDIFGQKIALTHNGDHAFKTRLGGVMTILMAFGVLSWFSFGLVNVFTDKIQSLYEEIKWLDVDQKE